MPTSNYLSDSRKRNGTTVSRRVSILLTQQTAHVFGLYVLNEVLIDFSKLKCPESVLPILSLPWLLTIHAAMHAWLLRRHQIHFVSYFPVEDEPDVISLFSAVKTEPDTFCYVFRC